MRLAGPLLGLDQMVDGMDAVDKIKKGGEHNNGVISRAPDKIRKARVENEA